MHSSKVSHEGAGESTTPTRSWRILKRTAIIAGFSWLTLFLLPLGIAYSTTPGLENSNPRIYTCCVTGSDITPDDCTGYRAEWDVLYGNYYEARCPLDPARSTSAVIYGPCRADYNTSLADQATRPVDTEHSRDCYVYNDGHVVWMTTSIRVNTVAKYMLLASFVYGALLVVIGSVLFIVMLCTEYSVCVVDQEAQ